MHWVPASVFLCGPLDLKILNFVIESIWNLCGLEIVNFKISVQKTLLVAYKLTGHPGVLTPQNYRRTT